ASLPSSPTRSVSTTICTPFISQNDASYTSTPPRFCASPIWSMQCWIRTTVWL
ncbi:hypothetical protein KIN20_033477, partial [Parelaphostrongylus tenuis]